MVVLPQCYAVTRQDDEMGSRLSRVANVLFDENGKVTWKHGCYEFEWSGLGADAALKAVTFINGDKVEMPADYKSYRGQVTLLKNNSD